VKLWPTATATDAKASGSAGYSTESGRHAGVTLTDATVRSLEARTPDWPTPMNYGRAGISKLDIRARGLYPEDPRYWPTPDASVSNDGEDLDSWFARREKEKLKGQNGNGMGMPLAIAARLWPTPRAHDSESPGGFDTTTEGGPSLPTTVRLMMKDEWATPTARDWKSGRASEETRARNARPLGEQVLWPTPQAHDASGAKTPEQIEAMREAAPKRAGGGPPGLSNLNEAVLWPTPAAADGDRASGTYARGNQTLTGQVRLSSSTATAETDPSSPDSTSRAQDAERSGPAASPTWPTPQARDEKGPTGMNGRDQRSSLSDMAMPGATAGRLNPAWVEALMGFPPGWTDGLPVPAKRSTRGSRHEPSPDDSPTEPHDSDR